MVTRADPVLPLYRYRLEDLMVEVRVAELAFTDAEAAELLALCGVTVAPASVVALNARTKGWVTGLRFAIRTLQHCADPDAAVAAVAGDSGNIGEYLAGEVLARQSHDVRELLLRTSIPETLQPGLSEALGGAEAQPVLARLTRVNAFIEELPEHKGFYRYHPFFRELLLAELAHESPESLDHLQRTAAEWYARQGLLTSAVNHFAAVGAWGEAAACVVGELAVGELLLAGGSSPLVTTLRGVPPTLLDPAAAVVRATLAMVDGDLERFDDELELVSEHNHLSGKHGEPVALVQAVAVLRALRVCGGDARSSARPAAEAADRALRRRETRTKLDRHPELSGLVHLSRGVAAIREGDLAAANALFLEVCGRHRPARGVPSMRSAWVIWPWSRASRGKPPEPSRWPGRRWKSSSRRPCRPLTDRLLHRSCWPGWTCSTTTWAPQRRACGRPRASSAPPRYPVVRMLRNAGEVAAAGRAGQQGRGVGRAGGRDRVGARRGVARGSPSGQVAHLQLAGGRAAAAALALEEMLDRDRADIGLLAAEVALEKEDEEFLAAVAALLRHEATLDVRVSCLLLEVRRQLRAGTEARARTALEASLHLAEPKQLRRPFREAPSDVQALLTREAGRGRDLGWLGEDYAEGYSAAVLATPARSRPRPGPSSGRRGGPGPWRDRFLAGPRGAPAASGRRDPHREGARGPRAPREPVHHPGDRGHHVHLGEHRPDARAGCPAEARCVTPELGRPPSS